MRTVGAAGTVHRHVHNASRELSNRIGSIRMHQIDRLGALVAGSPKLTEPLFQHGWGPYAGLMEDLGRWPTATNQVFEAKPPVKVADITITDLRFASPYPWLPDSSRLGYVRLLSPDSPDRVVLMMASFNDHGYDTRQAIAKYLLRRNIAVAILENPFYGLRRPREGQPLQTASDLLTMGIAAVRDGLEVLAMLRSRDNWQLGVAGYSMGANTAALVAAVSDGPVACAALAASHSPGPVFTEGALRASVDWEALGGDGAVADLAGLFGQATVLRFEPQAHLSKAVILGVEGDGYVPRSATIELASHWPGSELHWIPGGHATVLWSRKRTLADLIERSFDRLDDVTPRELRL